MPQLPAWRRRRKLRNLYDLNLFGRGSVDEPLIRRLLVLKVWHDVVNDGLGAKSFDPAEIVADIDARWLPPEDIGLLTQPVDPVALLARVRSRYAFVTSLDEVEKTGRRCNPGDRYEVTQLVASLRPTRQQKVDLEGLEPIECANSR